MIFISFNCVIDNIIKTFFKYVGLSPQEREDRSHNALTNNITNHHYSCVPAHINQAVITLLIYKKIKSYDVITSLVFEMSVPK